jgi:hypothetical protein
MQCYFNSYSFNHNIPEHNVRMINITNGSDRLIFSLDSKTEILKFLLGEGLPLLIDAAIPIRFYCEYNRISFIYHFP